MYRKPVINIGDVNHSLMGRTRQLHDRRRKPNILEGVHPTTYRGGGVLPKLMFLPLKTAGSPKPAVFFAIFCRIFEKIRHI